MANDINIGNLKVTADTGDIDKMKEKLADLKEGVPTVGSLIDSFVNSIKEIPGPVGAAAVGLAALGAAEYELIASTMESEEALLKAATAMGTTVEAAQQLQLAMQLGGVGADQLTQMTSRLSKAMADAAADPFSKAALALQKFGVSQQEIKDGDVTEVLQTIGSNLGKFTNDANLSAATMQLLGRNAAGSKEALADLAENTDKAKQAIADYGIAVTQADAEASKNFLKTLTTAGSMFQSIGLNLTRSLTPALQELVNEFAESGKEGGVMADIISAVTTTLTFLGKVLLEVIVEPARDVITIFKEIGTAIGAFGAAAASVAHGDLAGARGILSGLGDDLQKIEDDASAASARFQHSLWDSSGLDEVAVTAKKVTESIGPLKDNSKYLLELAQALADAQGKYNASTLSVDAYNTALEKQKIAQDLLKQGISASSNDGQQAAAQIELAAKLNKEADENRAGMALSIQLQNQLAQGAQRQTTLDKANADIAKQNLDIVNPALAEQIRNEAALIDKKNQDLELTKLQNALQSQYTNLEHSKLDALKMTSTEIKNQGEITKLEEAQKSALVGKSADEQAQINALYDAQIQKVKELQQATAAYQQSAQGAFDGISQAVKQFGEDATNANKISNTLTTSFENGMAQALVSFTNGSKDAFKQFALAAIQQIELVIAKLVVLAAIKAASSFFGSGGVTGGDSTTPGYSARGSAWQYAASGIVTSATMVAPGTVAGEQGNSLGEAVLPLARTAAGVLGVQVAGAGGSSGGGGTVIQTTYQIQVDASGGTDPQATATKLANQIKQIQQIADTRIATQSRPGGILNPVSRQAF